MPGYLLKTKRCWHAPRGIICVQSSAQQSRKASACRAAVLAIHAMQSTTNRLQGWVGCVTGAGCIECIAGACCWGADCAGGYCNARFLGPVAHLHPGEMDMWPRVGHA